MDLALCDVLNIGVVKQASGIHVQVQTIYSGSSGTYVKMRLSRYGSRGTRPSRDVFGNDHHSSQVQIYYPVDCPTICDADASYADLRDAMVMHAAEVTSGKKVLTY